MDDEIVATGGFRRIGDGVGEIKRMRVHLSWQRQGFGQAIYSFLENRARELGFRVLRLDTSAQYIPAQRLYEKNGFKEYKRGILGGLETIYYEKHL